MAKTTQVCINENCVFVFQTNHGSLVVRFEKVGTRDTIYSVVTYQDKNNTIIGPNIGYAFKPRNSNEA
jgi:succinyl-CoA synthetase alpha subunit